MDIMKHLMTFWKLLKNTDTDTTITDVSSSNIDWEDFWYNEDTMEKL